MTGGFFDRPQSENRVQNGRYRLVDPETGQPDTWQRASNFGYPLADQFGLQRWRHREILKGLAARPDLVRVLQAMHAAGEWDRGKLDEILQTTQEVAGTSVEANEGTAIHDALRAADEGRDYPDWAEPYVRGYRAELERHGLSVVACERVVLNRAIGVAGKIDRVYQTQDARFVAGDIKTSGHLDLQALEIAVQVGTYAGAEWMEGQDGRLSRVAFDPDEAIIVHVSREHATTAVYRLPLILAQHGVNLAAQVRDWRTTKGLLLPYVRPVGAAPAPAALAAVEPTPQTPEQPAGRHLQAVPMVGQTRVVMDRIQQWTGTAWTDRGPAVPDHGTGITSGKTEDPGPAKPPSPAEPIRPVPSPNPADSAEIAADQPGLSPMRTDPGPHVAATAAELLRLNKAAVQEYGRARGFTDLAHNRPQLIELYRRAGLLAPDQGAPAAPPTEDPEDPRSDAFRRAALAEIASAQSVGALGQLNQRVTKAHGDAAWTDEMTEAARIRVEQLDDQARLSGDPAAEVLRRVATCASQHELAELWSDVTVGGSAPERWTDEVQRAAAERLEQIKTATAPAAENPFAQ